MSRLFRDVGGGSLCPQGSVVCIGAFDGLHLGHRALIGHAVGRARELALASIVLTFEPLPREYFAQGVRPARLSPPRARLEALSKLGPDRIGLLRFNHDLASMTARDFVQHVLVERLVAREVWVGPDFRFGKGREGDVALLTEMGAAHGFHAGSLAPVTLDGERVSASRIRDLLAAGELDHAARLLGRPYTLGGRVVAGRRLGRTLGYPTANLRLHGVTPALRGIFAVRVHGVAEAPQPGVASLGTRPTVDGSEPLLEAHVFDFAGDLYGRRIEVEFVAKLRDEEKFPDLPALVAQMHRDAAVARRILGIENDNERLTA